MIYKTNTYYRSLFTLLIPLLFIIISGCSKKVIDEDKFAKIYAEMIIAQDTANYTPDNFKPVQEVIFKRYGVSRAEYNSTVDSYNKDPQKWEKFFDKAIAYVETLKKPNQPARNVKPK